MITDVVSRFEVIELDGRMRDIGATPCIIGRDFDIDPTRLGAYYLRAPSDRVDDLVVLVGAVVFADRSVVRRVRRSWRRELHLSVPVLDPDFWSQPAIGRALRQTLRLLTGDIWFFTFRRRQQRLAAGSQNALAFGDIPALVMPFSNGLDSLASARLAAASRPGAGLVLVTTGRLDDPDRDWRLQHLHGRYHRVSIPFQLRRRKNISRFREPSFRSRAFLFGTMAGIAANMSNAERIVVAESGQGALGPWLTPVGNEVPDIRTHPTFTRQLAKLLTLIFDRSIHFEHPHIWNTKGETLTQLREQGLDDDWQRTRSCGRNARTMSLDGTRLQCGVCANCLLRRQSLLAAGLDEGHDRYYWPRLSAPSLKAAAALGARSVTDNDKRYAHCGILAMTDLAALAHADRDHLLSNGSATELAMALDEPAASVALRLHRLLETHRQEWETFVGAQGPASFLARWVEQASC